MFHVYLLKSIKDGKLYIGYTSNLKKRIWEHNSGLNVSTKHRLPLKLVYCESYANKDDALKREYNLKLFARAYKQLKLRVNKSIAS